MSIARAYLISLLSRVLSLISHRVKHERLVGIPPFVNPDAWSDNLLDFRKMCLQTNPEKRPQVEELLKHPFITSCPCTEKDLMKQIQLAKKIKKESKFKWYLLFSFILLSLELFNYF